MRDPARDSPTESVGILDAMVNQPPADPGRLPQRLEPRDAPVAPPPTHALAFAAALSHGGLAERDPWGPPRELPTAAADGRSGARGIWPFGLRAVSETLEVIALALLMFIVVRGIAQNFIVDGGSMEPSFQHADMVVVNKLAYRAFDFSWLPLIEQEAWRPFGTIEQGDVVVFAFPLGPERDFIKRVVALPGQTIEVRDEQVIVDGAVLEEPYLLQAPRYSFGPETVPPGHVFVLGDARNNSYDSHSWGMLHQGLIVGRAELRYWPLGRFGVVGHEEPTLQFGVEVSQSR